MEAYFIQSSTHGGTGLNELRVQLIEGTLEQIAEQEDARFVMKHGAVPKDNGVGIELRQVLRLAQISRKYVRGEMNLEFI